MKPIFETAGACFCILTGFFAGVAVCMLAANSKARDDSSRPERIQPDPGRSALAVGTSGAGVYTVHDLLDGIRRHESLDGKVLSGDGRKSLGPYHIQRAFWEDACEYGGLPWRYDSDVYDDSLCRNVIFLYFDRHEPKALTRGDLETLAKLFNGGPRWREKPATATYWRKVRVAMKGTEK